MCSSDLSDAQTSLHEDGVEHENRSKADETELLTECGEDEITFCEWDEIRESITQSGAEHAAGCQSVEALHNLVSLPIGVCERIQPYLYPYSDMSEQEIGDRRAEQEECCTECQPGPLSGCEVQH